MPDRTVVVTGLGAVSSLGSDLASTWEGLVAGRSGIGPITLFDASGFRTKLAAEVREMPDPGVSPRLLRRLSRTDVIGLTAAREALADSGLDLDARGPRPDRRRPRRRRLGPSRQRELLPRPPREGAARGARPTRVLNHPPDQTTDRIAELWGFLGPRATITTACSSSSTSLGYASDLIRSGLADVVVTGGADTFARLTHGGFNALRAADSEPCRPFDRNRKGLTIGEAVGNPRLRGGGARPAPRRDDPRPLPRLRPHERRPPHDAARAVGRGVRADDAAPA